MAWARNKPASTSNTPIKVRAPSSFPPEFESGRAVVRPQVNGHPASQPFEGAQQITKTGHGQGKQGGAHRGSRAAGPNTGQTERSVNQLAAAPQIVNMISRKIPPGAVRAHMSLME
jgi:hypothetical protein